MVCSESHLMVPFRTAEQMEDCGRGTYRRIAAGGKGGARASPLTYRNRRLRGGAPQKEHISAIQGRIWLHRISGVGYGDFGVHNGVDLLKLVHNTRNGVDAGACYGQGLLWRGGSSRM